MADRLESRRKDQIISNKRNIIVVFFPFKFKHITRSYIIGEFEILNETVAIFFVTKVLKEFQSEPTATLFENDKKDCEDTVFGSTKNYISIELYNGVLKLNNFRIEGKLKQTSAFRFIWICYNFREFSKCEILSSDSFGDYDYKSCFKFLKNKVDEKICEKKVIRNSYVIQFKNNCLRLLGMLILKLWYWNKKCLPVTKYLNFAEHFKFFLDGFVWIIRNRKAGKISDIKVINYLLCVLLDMYLGILFLQFLNSNVSLDEFPTLFLLTAESIVNTIKDVISWLRGDPAGLKLNWAFNKVLATFFSFHIDIWWTFLVYLKPVVREIAQVFLRFGVLGITFQASIIADLLTLVSFHVYCIYAYATKLYGIQISTLISLWRLFLGRKKNPFREKVDSCRYSSEQLFVGTLGFTILLFLLPTTILYYVVFASIRLLLLSISIALRLIRYYIMTLPIYSTLLWVIRSPKISAEIKVMPYGTYPKANFILLKVQPVPYSWWKTVISFKPDFISKPSSIKITNFLSSLMVGKLINPI